MAKSTSASVKIDAVVLAGTHLEKDKLIRGQNKSFLEFHGKPVVQWVIEALDRAESIDRIVVVGPIEKINLVREQSNIPFIAVEQKGQLVANGWVAFHTLCPQAAAFPTDFLEFLSAKEEGRFVYPPDLDVNTPYLFISGDVPLTVPEAVDDFVRRCLHSEADMYYGVTAEHDLKQYYPTQTRKGIKRPYVHFREHLVRVANIQIIRPLKFGRMHLIQSGYSVRKLLMWRNIFRVLKIILRLPYGLRGAGFVTLLQISAMMSRHGLIKWIGPIRRFCPESRLEWFISQFLQARFSLVESPFAGLSLDIDDESDYTTLLEMFAEWQKIEQKVTTAQSQPSPSQGTAQQ